MKKSKFHLQKGFNLIEVLIAMQIFAIAALGIANAMTRELKYNTTAEQRTGSILAAQEVLDSYRSEVVSGLPSANSSNIKNITIGSRTYQVESTFCPTGTTYCTGGSIRHIKVTVYLGGVEQYEVETIFSELQ
jgi:type II secretion system protein I